MVEDKGVFTNMLVLQPVCIQDSVCLALLLGPFQRSPACRRGGPLVNQGLPSCYATGVNPHMLYMLLLLVTVITVCWHVQSGQLAVRSDKFGQLAKRDLCLQHAAGRDVIGYM